MKRLAILAALTLPLLTAPACVTSATPGAAELALTDGAVDADPADDAVVALVSDDTVFCTGTLIASDVVLTAAHCAVEPSPPVDAILFGAGASARTVPVVETVVHPDFDPRVLANDLALVFLTEPSEVAPRALLVGPFDGTDVRVVGYGATDASEGPVSVGEAVRRSGAARLAGTTASHLVLQPGPSLTCHGDSGGPAFVTVDGVELLAGVTSSGDPRCESFGRETRVDRFADDFLAPYVTGATGSGCSGDGGASRSGLWIVGLVALRRRRTPGQVV